MLVIVLMSSELVLQARLQKTEAPKELIKFTTQEQQQKMCAVANGGKDGAKKSTAQHSTMALPKKIDTCARTVTKSKDTIRTQVKKTEIAQNSTPANSLCKDVIKKPTQTKVEPLKQVVAHTKQEEKERTIIISNNITQDMITYKKHWTGNYTPSTFTVKVNDQELKNDEATAVTVKDDTVQLTFNYEFKVFGKVQRAGARKVAFRVPKEVEKVTSTFSWDAPSNIIVDKGELISCQDIT